MRLNSSNWAVALLIAIVGLTASAQDAAGRERFRVIVSSDIGGTDPDDFQSMVHLLLYADEFDIEGLVSSPFGKGSRADIERVIDLYERDYPNLKTWSARYPAPSALRSVVFQGADDTLGPPGFGAPTEGSRRIVERARAKDPRPLYLLVWGGIDDLAQALHDAPDIASKLRVYFIGGPNKMWSVEAYDYVETNFPNLWIVESNSTYRGWFVGGEQSGNLGNSAFVAKYATGSGALGNFFASQLNATIKMGDSPSVGWLLRGDPSRPDSNGGWGGRFIRLWQGRKTVFTRHTTATDTSEAFGVTEFVLPVPAGMKATDRISALFDGRVPAVVVNDGKTLTFRFSPRDAKVWRYELKSDFAPLNGSKGEFTAVLPDAAKVGRLAKDHPNWWIDDQRPEFAEGIHRGAKTVNSRRAEFLKDFAARLERSRHARGGK